MPNNKFDANDVIKLFNKLEKRIDRLYCFIEDCCSKIPINIGDGIGIFKRLYHDKWEFKSLIAGDNIEITEQDETITITSTTEPIDCEDIDECLGISPEGDPTKFLNEQGEFVVVSAGGFTCSDLNSCDTDELPEGATNFYFTEGRARASISLTTTGTSGAATYNNITGVLNIPNYTVNPGTVTDFISGNLSPLFTTNVATSTSTPTLSFTQISQNQNLVFASPDGIAGNPTFRSLVAADLPSLSSIYVPTSRTITVNGNSQDLSADRTYTITTTGTANRISVSGGAATTPTIDIDTNYIGQTSITTLGTITTGTWNGTSIITTYGGTGLNSYAQGDLLYYDSGTVLSKLSKDTNTQRALTNGGTNNNPLWAQISLTNGVTDVLPVANGGTGSSVTLDPTVLLYRALGSTITTQTMGAMQITIDGTMVDQTLFICAIYVPVAQTITGVKWRQGTQGNYTANNYNGVGLYSYSGGTLTLVASSTNDGDIWKATGNTVASKAFSSTYSAQPGVYFIGALWCRSAVVAAPSIGSSTAVAASAVWGLDFTNSAKLRGNFAGQTSLPTPLASTNITGSTSMFWFALY